METPNTIAELASRLWRRGSRESEPDPHAAAAGSGSTLNELEARVHHLETALEGLQDAIYREAVIQSRKIDELRVRTEPSQMARDLSQNAREHGL